MGNQPQTLIEKFDILMAEAGPGGLSAAEMTEQLNSRGWLPAYHSVIDIADAMRDYYGSLGYTQEVVTTTQEALMENEQDLLKRNQQLESENSRYRTLIKRGSGILSQVIAPSSGQRLDMNYIRQVYNAMRTVISQPGDTANDPLRAGAQELTDEQQEAQAQQLDKLTDMETVLMAMADSLGVSMEPHQTFNQRLLETAYEAGIATGAIKPSTGGGQPEVQGQNERGPDDTQAGTGQTNESAEGQQ